MDPPADNWQNSYMPSNTGQSSPTLTVTIIVYYITHLGKISQVMSEILQTYLYVSANMMVNKTIRHYCITL